MRNILHSLYNGKIIPWERRNPDSEKQRSIYEKIEREEAYFLGKMPPEDCQRFQALSSLYMNSSAIEEENAFSYGFTLGLLMMMDIAEETKRIAGE